MIIKRKIRVWKEIEIESSIMYRARNFQLEEIPMQREVATKFYTMDGKSFPKNNTSDTFFSSNKYDVLDWLNGRRAKYILRLKEGLAKIEKLVPEYETIIRIKLSKEEETEIDTHEIVSIGKTIKTATMRDMMVTQKSKIKSVPINLYLKPDRVPIPEPTSQLVFGIWFVVRDDYHKVGEIVKWYQERIFWLENLDWK